MDYELEQPSWWLPRLESEFVELMKILLEKFEEEVERIH
jgi:hypothetical protein